MVQRILPVNHWQPSLPLEHPFGKEGRRERERGEEGERRKVTRVRDKRKYSGLVDRPVMPGPWHLRPQR